MALGRVPAGASQVVRAATLRVLYEELEPARRLLERRWPDAEARALHDVPVAAILAEARRFDADVIALGWRGHGPLRRLLAGSVSRAVVAQARVPVLVARTAAGEVRRIVVGFDGSPQAQRAVSFLARLEPRRRSTATVVTVVEPLWVPAGASRLPAATRATLRSEAKRIEHRRMELARRRAEAAAEVLQRAGWTARTEPRLGAPLETLLAASADLKADILAVGARSAKGLTRALLGSVSSGVLNHSRIPVLIVR